MSFVRGGSTVLLYCPRPLTKLLRVKLSASPLYSKELKSVLICASKSSVPDETADATVLATSISPSAPEALHNVDLSSYGFGGWLPTDLTPFLFELPYNYLQLPWWGAIATVALLVRLSLFPWALQNRIAGGRLAVVSERSIPINNKMEDAKRANDSYEISKASSELMRLYSEHKVSPFTAFKFPMMQGVAFLSVFWGLKSMIVQSVVGLKAGGALWFPNLLQPDPYGVLPVLSGLLLLTNIRVGFLSPFLCTPVLRVIDWSDFFII